MLFYAYDLGSYIDWRGFYYPYEEFVPGPICRTEEELILGVKELETSFDGEKVKKFKEKYMSSCDGKATERVIKMILGE